MHVVFGAGQVGAGLADALGARGHTVRVARRSDRAVGSHEVVAGDLMDPAFAIQAARGAEVIYHCTNPSAYTSEAWNDEGKRLCRAAVEAAIANDARLVVLDNVYAYGPGDAPRTPQTPMQPSGDKGRMRQWWSEYLAKAARERGLRYVVGRAGDFFGPGTSDQSLMSDDAFAGLAQGRAMWLVGDIDAPHAFSYVPDVVLGLAELGAADGIEGEVFHLPVLVTSPRALVADVARELGVRARMRRLPAWFIRVLGVVVPLFKNLRETLYQWDRPFLVSDDGFRQRFPGIGRDLQAAAAEVASAARA